MAADRFQVHRLAAVAAAVIAGPAPGVNQALFLPSTCRDGSSYLGLWSRYHRFESG